MSLDPWRMLGGNLRVALNLEIAKRKEEKRKQWIALEKRADAIGCDLVWGQDGPYLYDRNGDVIDLVGTCDEESQDYPMTLHFIEQLEKNGGIR